VAGGVSFVLVDRGRNERCNVCMGNMVGSVRRSALAATQTRANLKGALCMCAARKRRKKQMTWPKEGPLSTQRTTVLP